MVAKQLQISYGKQCIWIVCVLHLSKTFHYFSNSVSTTDKALAYVNNDYDFERINYVQNR
jgi:hypothetical protein